jgi:hypothetical protein
VWKQYANIILGILVALMAVSGVAVTWIVIAGILIAFMAIGAVFEVKKMITDKN